MKITKVYTRRGDQGMTDLVGGIRINKNHPRLDAYGTIDELSSHLGLLVSLLPSATTPDESSSGTRLFLQRIQNNLFNVGTHLATDQSQTPLYDSARLPNGETDLLEQEIDSILHILPEAQGFVLPGGTTAAAQCHVCRTVCRRAERCIIELIQTDTVSEDILKYVNRLSDYLFVLAKKINFNAGQNEILWQNACK